MQLWQQYVLRGELHQEPDGLWPPQTPTTARVEWSGVHESNFHAAVIFVLTFLYQPANPSSESLLGVQPVQAANHKSILFYMICRTADECLKSGDAAPLSEHLRISVTALLGIDK